MRFARERRLGQSLPESHTIGAARPEDSRRRDGTPSACPACRRRSWLLGELSPVLDWHRGDPGRLFDLLALNDEKLIAAVGGRRREELAARHAAWDEATVRRTAGGTGTAICRHADAAPAGLRTPGSPHMLHVSGPHGRFAGLTARRSVAILGSIRASDYGREMARSLARGLSVSGMSVLGAFRPGICAAAHEGVLEAGGETLAVLDGALSQPAPGALKGLRRAVERQGFLLAELPDCCNGRVWGAHAADRTLIALAGAAILIEDEPQGRASRVLALAQARGVAVGALPGPVTSRLSAGPHAAVLAGAQLVRKTEDVLDLLAGTGSITDDDVASEHAGGSWPAALAPRLREALRLIGTGVDAPEALARNDREDRGETLAALAELELLGLVRRTATGRYVACDPA